MTRSTPATATLIASIPDVMADVRVGEAARAAGVPLDSVNTDAWAAALAADPRPAGAVVDLSAPGAIDRIGAAVAAGVPVLAYGPHVEADLLTAARRAGARRVVPRGRMMQHAGALLAELLAGSAADEPSRSEDSHADEP
ncbi:MAG: hypothetical protein IT332_12275 [Ardenticatenales bacterium]|nr:hypothetical protein [Ardenticatenales bacterium]